MLQQEIKSINEKSLGKMIALIYGVIGFFVALVVAISSMANIIARENFQNSVVITTLFNIAAALLLSVLNASLTALIGWIIGYITAGIYNWFAEKVGGVKIQFEEAAEITKDKINNQLFKL